LLAFGQGCHFWVDRVSRIAGLIIGAIQLCRYLLTTQISKTKTTEMSEKRSLWLRTCDHITAVLLIMETIHVVTRWRSEAYEKAQKLRPADEPSRGSQLLTTPFEATCPICRLYDQVDCFRRADDLAGELLILQL